MEIFVERKKEGKKIEDGYVEKKKEKGKGEKREEK